MLFTGPCERVDFVNIEMTDLRARRRRSRLPEVDLHPRPVQELHFNT